MDKTLLKNWDWKSLPQLISTCSVSQKKRSAMELMHSVNEKAFVDEKMEIILTAVCLRLTWRLDKSKQWSADMTLRVANIIEPRSQSASLARCLSRLFTLLH